MSKTYELSTIPDILAIDPQDFEEFIEDIKVYYSLFKPMRDLGAGVPDIPLKFTADGKHEHKITVIKPEGKS